MRNLGKSIVALFGVSCVFCSASVWADTLDSVTGMEDWAQQNVIDLETEWNEWLESRASLRTARRAIEMQRERNSHLAQRPGLRKPLRLRRRKRKQTISAGSPKRIDHHKWKKQRSTQRDDESVRQQDAPMDDPLLQQTQQRQRTRRKR